ncbi:MAG: hypothetical protein WC089_04385 [Candidatus Paceibacterota bacterium]
MAKLKTPKEADMYPDKEHLEKTMRALKCRNIHGAYFAHNLILLSRISEDHDWLKRLTSNAYLSALKDVPGIILHGDHYDCFKEFTELEYLERVLEDEPKEELDDQSEEMLPGMYAITKKFMETMPKFSDKC